MLPLITIIDEGLSAYLAVPLPAGSPCFDEFCLDEGEEDVDDEEEEEGEEEEVLSLLQLESRQRLPAWGGLATSGLTFSLPGVWPLSRQPASFLQPKSGRRMLSMKKFVVLWPC